MYVNIIINKEWILYLLCIFCITIAYRKSMETKKQAKVYKKSNTSQKEEEEDSADDVMVVENPQEADVIELDSDSESEKENTNNESVSSSE